MYAHHTNNPFLNENQDDASSRYPDINNIGSPQNMGGPSQWQSQPQYGQPSLGYNHSGFMQQQPQQHPGYMQPQPSFGYGMGQGVPQAAPYSPAQQYPGQHSQLSSMQYQPQYPMSPVGSTPTGFPYQTQQSNNYNTVADLDPYSNLSNTSFANTQSQPQSQPQYSTPGSQPQTQHGDHPRTFVQKFKTELEQWDTAAWKQVMLRIADLRSAWEVRKRDLNGALEGARFNGWTPGEMQQCQTMIKEAGDNVGKLIHYTCHASEFQLKEVQSGYRHSTDPASKNRVRDALNAGLRSLPEYPPPL
ncbi:unnamed protein product [Rhizoctonia solani]|uniref:Uncharacterized protein n=1 Tax=Rhizoctonia solani TaxID=456999 RepID=A0A8H2WKZ4_9AGAM|nr:unnamed protein product [Rhizoctonia solani]